MKNYSKKKQVKLARALKQNIIRRKEKKMGIMPDFWIKKMAKSHKMIDPFVEKLVKKMFCHMGCLLMVTMLVFQNSLKYLLM